MNLPPGSLAPHEQYWKQRQPWLKERGYNLRPRYRPDWKPSWEGTNKFWFECEDGRTPIWSSILDATRISDGKVVMLKKISKQLHPYEIPIGEFFSSEPVASDPRNHCVPIIDVMQDPDEEDLQIIVMPLLRLWNDPPFNTIGEVVEFFRQIFEGMAFMHEHHVAHRDFMLLNVMMDPEPMFPNLFHPMAPKKNRKYSGKARHFSRTRRPTKYYLIDFGLSRTFDADNPAPRELPIIGGDKTVPEHKGRRYYEACDPFAADVYCVGNLIRTHVLPVSSHSGANLYLELDFMGALVAHMTQSDPEDRPVMSEVVRSFDEICCGLSTKLLRRRLVPKEEDAVSRRVMSCVHWINTLVYIILRLPPQPQPKTKGRLQLRN
ncbi:hypothetical protein CERSUDRAFT_56679 [Gelatoporia subvermispora B]|uniref:Protein kinase domain-containing protein n=1 Tax=Ceriporiopsis subvermispora (strain B) TaxID=914234 RepID=M2R409_CERS8|nr:hypothetical protein CERSUDRAFT_56679 [Gelatoporia subvermispora B]